MIKKLMGLGIAAAIGLSITTTKIYAGADYPSMTRTTTPMHQIVLEPGWRSSCSSDFVVQNLSKDMAQIEITLGKDGKIKDVIYQWDKRGYELIPSLSFAKQLGKTVDIDDVAMIKNTSQNSKVSTHC